MHTKRQTIKKFWPIPRKGTKYIATPAHEKASAIPLVVVFRDILKLVEKRKELKTLINDKDILVNNKIVRELNFPILLFDTISIPRIKKYYKAVYSKFKKISFVEINENESFFKIYKVIDKRILPKRKVQINLVNGENLFYDKPVDPGASIILNTKERKVSKVLKLSKGAKMMVIRGKYLGLVGQFINNPEGKRFIEIKLEDKIVNLRPRDVMVVE